MAQFDAALKHLIDAHPEDWAEFFGAPPDAQIELLDPVCASTLGWIPFALQAT